MLRSDYFCGLCWLGGRSVQLNASFGIVSTTSDGFINADDKGVFTARERN